MAGRGEISALEPLERRIAMMHVANASLTTIAQVLEMNTGMVQIILSRPRVAQFMLLLHGVVSEGLEEGVKDLNYAIKQKAARAFELETLEMESLHDMGEDPDIKPAIRVRAKLGTVFTARDILDRAGHRAPTKIYNYGSSELPPEAAEALTNAARELADLRKRDAEVIDITPGMNGTDSST